MIIHNEGVEANEGARVVADWLISIIDLVPDLWIFVQRLAWVPINFPLCIDNGEVTHATKVLIQVEHYAQVLTGVFVNPDALIDYLEYWHPSLIDLLLFGPSNGTLLGKIELFEDSVYYDSCALQLMPGSGRLLGATQRPVSDVLFDPEVLVYHMDMGVGMDVSISEAGLARATPLRVDSMAARFVVTNSDIHNANFASKETLYDLAAAHGARAIAYDSFRHGGPRSLSMLDNMDHAKLDSVLLSDIESGSIILLDTEGKVILWMHKKGRSEKWLGFGMPWPK